MRLNLWVLYASCLTRNLAGNLDHSIVEHGVAFSRDLHQLVSSFNSDGVSRSVEHITAQGEMKRNVDIH